MCSVFFLFSSVCRFPNRPSALHCQHCLTGATAPLWNHPTASLTHSITVTQPDSQSPPPTVPLAFFPTPCLRNELLAPSSHCPSVAISLILSMSHYVNSAINQFSDVGARAFLCYHFCARMREKVKAPSAKEKSAISRFFHVHVACPRCMLIPHIHAVCPCYMYISHAPAACLCNMLMLHVHAGCPSCMSILDLCWCPCCMSMLHIQVACKYCFSMLHGCMSLRHVHTSCP